MCSVKASPSVLYETTLDNDEHDTIVLSAEKFVTQEGLDVLLRLKLLW